ncbi:hypothetical protein [Leuconostoc lactis]|uniref:hypothetical protein n=1 Tax=Leuconostoc lactis TaxID=1246 RepID=UPI0035E3F276
MPNRKALAQIGYMAQNDALYETLTGYDNLKFFAQMRDIKELIVLCSYLMAALSLMIVLLHSKHSMTLPRWSKYS